MVEVSKQELWRKFWWYELRKRWGTFLVLPLLFVLALVVEARLYFVAFFFVVWFVAMLAEYAQLFMEWVDWPVTLDHEHAILVPDFNAKDSSPKSSPPPPVSPPRPDPA